MDRSFSMDLLIFMLIIASSTIYLVGVWGLTYNCSLHKCTAISLSSTNASINAQKYSNITQLVISIHELKVIPNNLLRDFPRVEEIRISSDSLESISLYSMERRHFVRKLMVLAGNFEIIENFSFEDFWYLNVLYIENVPIKVIERYVFVDLLQLEQITIKKHKIEYLPEGLFDQLYSLTSLVFHDGNLKKIESYLFVRNTKLEFLHFSRNSLNDIGEQEFGGTKISLYYNANNFSGTFKANQRIVFAKRNQIKTLFIEKVVGILHVDHNQIMEVKCNRYEKYSLTVFSASYNQLENLNCIEYMENLTNFDGGYNNFRNVSTMVFRELRNLKVLRLVGNPLLLIDVSKLLFLRSLLVDMNQIVNSSIEKFDCKNCATSCDIYGILTKPTDIVLRFFSMEQHFIHECLCSSYSWGPFILNTLINEDICSP